MGGLLLVVTAVFAWQIAPYHPQISVGQALLPPSAAHWFGTDDLGRDTFSKVIHGARPALLVGLLTAATSLGIGVTMGMLAGYLGGWVDDILMRVAEAFQLLPRFFLILLLVTMFGGNLWLVAILLGVTFWPGTARILRSQVLTIRHREYVVAARSLGADARQIMLRHVLPNSILPVVVTVAAQISGAIITEAGLSFLGLGDPTWVTWGQMLNDAQRFMRTAWWLSVFPGLALALTVLITTTIADGVNDAL
jgi:peptide/nickel transport system permease protein